MDYTLLIISLLFISIFFILSTTTQKNTKIKLPPGSMGLPLIGHSLQLLRAMRSNTVQEWLDARTKRYGPVWKTNLLGKPTVVLVGHAANKFVFSNGQTLSSEPPPSALRILGDRNLLALHGNDHRRVRAAVMSFLRPEMLKQYVGKMDAEVKEHLDTYWRNQQTIKVLPDIKIFTFDTICSLLFGMEKGHRRERLIKCYHEMLAGVLTVPLNLPFTPFNQSLKAAKSARSIITELIREKKEALKQGLMSPSSDMISCLISMQGDEKSHQVTDQEIVDNVFLLMGAGHENTSAAMTFFIRLLAKNPQVYDAVVHEQVKIAKMKAKGEALTWEDVGKMKYTTQTMMELLRLIPPSFFGFRKVWEDLEYNGYTIPKGWQITWFVWPTHLDETIFPKPLEFDPSRFDGQTPVVPYSYIPFGAGPRVCPGYEFAKLQLLVGIHHIVTQFRWELVCKEEDDRYIWEPTPTPTEGLPVHLQPFDIYS